MKRVLAIVGSLVLVAAGGVASSVVAGKAPASILTHTTGHSESVSTTVTTTVATTTETTTTTTPRPPRKVTLCHHTRSKKNPHVSISVSRNAVPAHVRHGDTPGPCTTASNIRKHSTKAHVRRNHKHMTLRAERIKELKAAKKKRGKGR